MTTTITTFEDILAVMARDPQLRAMAARRMVGKSGRPR